MLWYCVCVCQIVVGWIRSVSLLLYIFYLKSPLDGGWESLWLFLLIF